MEVGTPPSSEGMMCSTDNNPPVLALSDIMHPMSPSPVPLEEQQTTSASVLDALQATGLREWSPEPLTESEISNIRNRLHQMGLITTYSSDDEQLLLRRVNIASDLSLRERELTDMILRLIQCPRIDPSQLEDQAFTILTLTTQRDLLITQITEERLRWRSELESWDRTAEALLTQKTRPLKSEDVDAQRSAYETELKAMRDKLHDRHRRISALEQEILRLRPLLLMQPYSSSRIKQTPNSQGPKTKPQDKGKRRDIDSLSTQSTLFNTIQDEANSYRGSVQKSNTANYPYGYQYKPDAPSSSSAPLRVSADPPSNSHPFLFEGPSASNATSQRRRSKDHSMPHKTKKQKHQRTSLMTSDAYAEHVLLAAQKIGRKRAALLTLQRITGREKESYFNEQDETKERDGQEKEVLGSANFGSAYYRASTDASPRQGTSGSGSRLPKTPKRSDCTISPNNNMNPVGVNTPPSTYVFVDASGTPVPNLPFHNPRSVTNTPSHLGAPVKLTPGIRSTSQSNPPTPMHSLLDAARMMDESNHKSSSKRRSHVDPESPTGKRRRISTEKQPSTRSSRITRVKSALDVLAESAAAVNDSTKADGSVGACASDNVSKVKANSTESGSEANYSSVSRSSTRTIRPSSLKLPVPPDEAKIATSSMTTERGAKSLGRHKSSAVHETRLIPRPSASSSLHRIASTGLRPVVVWGDRPVSDEDGDEDEDDGYSDAPQTKQHVRQGKVGVAHPRRRHGNNSLGYCPYPTEVHDGVKGLASGSLEVLESNHDSRTSPANVLDNAGTTHRDTSLLSRFQIVSAPETATPGTPHLPASSTHSLQHGTLEAGVQGTFAEGDEAITDVAADEDEDAEGEDEDDPESEIEINDRPSRFRSPPPPDPPFSGPGPGNEPPDDEHDADAEGEKDFDERGTYPAGQASKPRTETASGQHKDKSFWRIHFSLAAIHVSFLQVKGPICPDIFPAHHGTEWLSKRGEQPTAILTQKIPELALQRTPMISHTIKTTFGG